MTSTTVTLLVGWLLGAGCMMLREHYRDRAHRETMRVMRARALADAAAHRRQPRTMAVANWPQVDREASSHAASRDRRDSTLET